MEHQAEAVVSDSRRRRGLTPATPSRRSGRRSPPTPPSRLVFNGALAGAVAAAKRSGRDLPERVELQDLVLIGAASYKLSRLSRRRRSPSFVRAPFTELQGKGGPAELEEKARGRGLRRARRRAAVCPYCLGLWASGALPRGAPVRAARDPLQRIGAHGDDDLGLPPDRLQGRRGLRRAASRRGRRTRSPMSGSIVSWLW